MIEEKKAQIIAKINEIQDEHLLDEIAILFEGDDWWDKINEAKKASIHRGLKQTKEGQGVPHEKVMSDAKKLLDSWR